MGRVSIGPAGQATVTFADGVSLTFPTNHKPSDVGGGDWHEYNVGPLSLPTLQPINAGRPMPFVRPIYFKYLFEVQDAWMALRDYPALEYIDFDGEEFGNPVSTGSRTKVDLFGHVAHIVNNEKRVLVNQTLPGHTLHEGYVVRHVWAQGREVKIQSIGFGTGRYGPLNSAGSLPVWGMVSVRTIRNMAIRYYEKRTGRQGTITTQDPFFEKAPATDPRSALRQEQPEADA